MTCDVCGLEKPTEVVTISRSGRTFVVELCETHIEPINILEEKGSDGPRKRAQSKPATHRVIPID